MSKVKNYKKRVLAIVTIVILMFSMMSCGNNQELELLDGLSIELPMHYIDFVSISKMISSDNVGDVENGLRSVGKLIFARVLPKGRILATFCAAI